MLRTSLKREIPRVGGREMMGERDKKSGG